MWFRVLHHRTTRHLSLRTVHSTTALLMSIDTSPPVCRINEGTKVLDRDIFRKSIAVLAIQIPAVKSGFFLTGLKTSVLELRKTRNVIPDREDKEKRLVLLKYHNKEPLRHRAGFERSDELPGEAAHFIEKEGATLTKHEIELNYDFWTADDILQSVLPKDLCDGSPTGFAIMGHLAHVNLNAEYLPYKHVIGQVIMNKNPRIRTVVNKLDKIHTQFRYFEMELIAGEPDFVVQHRESDCRFTFDFREVYWNSRLHSEHERLVRLFQPEDGVIVDVMAGVGPFAVPAAKKGCVVLANDLNPNSAKWLQKNVEDNNVAEDVRVYCEDGRDFIRSSFKRAFTDPFPPFTGKRTSKRQQQKQERRARQDKAKDSPAVAEANSPSSPQLHRNRVAHFVMNLPDTAIEFLDAFKGVLDDEERELSGRYEIMPLVHCHCFTRFLDAGEAGMDIRMRVETALGGELEDSASLHYVRSVAPNKDMYCISFRLPRKVAFQGQE